MADVKFPKPLFHGGTRRAHTKVISERDSKLRPRQGLVEFEHTMTTSVTSQRRELRSFLFVPATASGNSKAPGKLWLKNLPDRD